MSRYETIDYTVENGVAWVRLNRPEKMNSFNSVMQQELATIWRGPRRPRIRPMAFHLGRSAAKRIRSLGVNSRAKRYVLHSSSAQGSDSSRS